MRRLSLLAIGLFIALPVFAQKGAPRGPGPKSKPELEAINAVIQAPSLDAKIAAVDNLITKFSTTDFKSFALYQAAFAYEQKGDHAKAIVYAEQALQADPANFEAESLIANVTAVQIRDTDLDKAEKLALAEKDAKHVLEEVKTVPKTALFPLTDQQWTMTKNLAASQAWQALGTAALVQKKPDEAVADYQKGLELDADPALMLRIGRALMTDKKVDEAITWFDKAAAAPDATDQIKKIAANDKARAMQAKGAAPAPAKPAQE
jgi:tetratricopeptide (TPR) repeat protein